MPPGDLSSSGLPGAVDRALERALEEDYEGALRSAASLVKERLAAPVPLFITAWALSQLDQADLARETFELCADRAAGGGNLTVAVAALSELRRLGGDPDSRIESFSADYAKGSSRIGPAAASPPDLGAPREESPLLAEGLRGDALVDEVRQILDYAKASWESEKSAASSAKLPPQRLFSSLGPAACAGMMRACTARIVPRSYSLIEEGTTGDEAFILARGEVEVTRRVPEKDPVLLARLGNGALFGEMSLLSRASRAASVATVVPSIVLTIEREALNAVATEAPEVATAFAAYCRRRMVQNLIRTSPILGAFNDQERAALMEKFISKAYEKGDLVIRVGSSAEGLHLIASGRVAVSRPEGDETVTIARLGVGEVVGEVAMVLRRPANADVVAETPTVTMHLPQEEFMTLIREHPTLLSRLYELAVQRDEETSSIVAQEASEADELII